MNKSKQDDVKFYFKMLILFLTVFSLSLLFFFFGMKRGVQNRVEATLNDNVAKQSHLFHSIIETNFNYLEGLAAYIGESEDFLSQDNLSLILSVRETSGFSKLCLIETDGTAHYDDGSVKSVAERRYFREGMSGQNTLSDPLESKVDGETRVVLGVPVTKNGEVIGMLGGSYGLSTLSHMMFDDIYAGAGFSMILLKDGSIISYNDTRNVLPVSENANFFALYQSLYGTSRQLEAVRNDFLNGQNGYTQLDIDGGGYYLTYSTMDYNDWMFCYMVPVIRAHMDFEFIQYYELILITGFVLSLLIILPAIMLKTHHRHRELLRFANTDALTGLCTKKNTEDSIQDWLTQSTAQHTGLQGFMIIDIDLFKEINDQLGHAAGDEVLRNIGSILKKSFRENDIVGRIGGDEFVVFMKNVDVIENLERRAIGLLSAVKRLSIPELKGKSVTCSIGIAAAPMHGSNYLELYNHADMALYETKDRGKNGYSIYAHDPEFVENSEGKWVRLSGTGTNQLTGLYYNKTFFQIVDTRLKSAEKSAYQLVAIDIEHFRLFNRIYGRAAGDDLLVDISGCLKAVQDQSGGVAGYMGADNFCLLIPNDPGLPKQLLKDIIEKIQHWTSTVGFLPAFGIYVITDPSLTALNMYDRATMALSHIYGNYTNRIRYYKTDMEKTLEDEITLISDVQQGILHEEFTFYLQPQCNISGDSPSIVGAESLVRWKRSDGTIVPPGKFIPVLEKNGLITELDQYIWEKVCIWQRSWIDRGNTPVLVSVNISRLDIFSIDVPDFLAKLIDRYRLKPSFIKVEITESAYVQNDERVNNTAIRLRQMGFQVLIDDFGSGYSSLNMLSSMEVNALKLDVRFLEFNRQTDKKGLRILESIISMSRQIDLPVIVEGIETEEQEKYLTDMGCQYVQGFYYYKPMPVDAFEDLIGHAGNLDRQGFTSTHSSGLNVRQLLNESAFNDVLLNHVLGPIFFSDVTGKKLEISSANHSFTLLTGISCEQKECGEIGERFLSQVPQKDREIFLDILEKAYRLTGTAAEGTIHFQRTDGRVLLLHVRIFFLWEREMRRAFSGSLTDITNGTD